MRLSLEKVRTDKKYRIGYIALIDEYVMAVEQTVNGMAADDYFRIAPDVYELYKGFLVRLDLIADGFKEMSEKAKEFLFSDNMEKNNEEQKQSYLLCRDSQKDRVTGGFDWI